MVVGEFVGAYGVRGWSHIRSFTQPLENLLGYLPWRIGAEGHWSEVEVTEGRRHGRGLIAKIEGVDDRESAAGLRGSLIAVRREQLPDRKGEFYWADLEGLEVRTREGESLGRIDHLMETGANDVMVVKGDRERLIPFVQGQYVVDIDLEAGQIVVDWDADF